MNHILDHIGLYIVEDGQTNIYKRIFNDNGIPNYYPSALKNQIYRDMYVDEIMFLPIELEAFEHDRKHRFYGYRYLINSSGHCTVSLGPDPLRLGTTRVQLTIEVRRFRYYISEDSKIIIDKSYDSLYPPYMVNIEDNSSRIGHTLQNVVQNFVDKYNEFYMDRQI